MEVVGTDRMGGRPIRFLELSEWAWRGEPLRPFILFVAASAGANDRPLISRFASDAIDSGCRCVCAWGVGCELVHDLFDEASIAADQFIMSSWHSDESLADALYFALTNAICDPDTVPDWRDAEIVLAVEEPWASDVRRWVSDQEGLAKLVLAEYE